MWHRIDDSDGRGHVEVLVGPKRDILRAHSDVPSKRIYASDGIAVVVYQERDPNHYTFIGKADTGLMSKTGLFVPELHRYFATVPHIGSQAGKILVFKTQ